MSAELTASDLVGRWHFTNEPMRVVAEFSANGTFTQTTTAENAQESYSGRYQMLGQILTLAVKENGATLQFVCQRVNADILALSDAAGNSVRMYREKAVATAATPAAPATPTTPAAPASSPASSAKKPPVMVLERTWEPNERAYWFLKPKGWQISGGIFNVDPLKMNGPGNTLAPKNDLTVKLDAAGTVMFRWAPVWYYADLTYAPLAGSFPVGSYYRGMLVKPMPTAKEFLLEGLRAARPGLAGLKIVAEDPMREMVEAYQKVNAQLNQSLASTGVQPAKYDAAALLVEYNEGGQLFRETLVTVLVDTRASAFMWSNERTVHLRAPAADFALWKPVLDTIRTSDHMNPQWVASMNRERARRTQMAQDTDSYLRRVANEIVEHRRQANAEIRHEQWLFISGQEEYKNPYTGEIERDSSAYRHRWVNNQGDVILTDQNDFDPNDVEAYKTREWKPTPIWDRKKTE